jgi:hypothetical protein
MKFVATILLAVIIVSSAMPCCAAECWMSDACPTEQHDTDDAHADDCSGTCSPFCFCSACGGFTVIHLFADFQAAPQEFSKTNSSFYRSAFYRSPSSNGIWQPPKY